MSLCNQVSCLLGVELQDWCNIILLHSLSCWICLSFERNKIHRNFIVCSFTLQPKSLITHLSMFRTGGWCNFLLTFWDPWTLHKLRMEVRIGSILWKGQVVVVMILFSVDTCLWQFSQLWHGRYDFHHDNSVSKHLHNIYNVFQNIYITRTINLMRSSLKTHWFHHLFKDYYVLISVVTRLMQNMLGLFCNK